ncbi:alpha/beta hydrolase [Jeotgalibacillus soli]|uniref:BD-FAE-like domain-containing protein n=1 Tax=Jeotgalibacillus soli TaxID=889306 RepID=A0A0C2VHJ3_9BACL|nr:alpha/beta hydrolase [Jeotgalibacillus soli]KIL43961.1 hypothetical protein KP78_37850 [Jeotgalibacillus soli]
MERKKNLKGWKKTLRIAGLTVGSLTGVIVFLIVSFLIMHSFTPAPFVTYLQKSVFVTGEVNSFEPKSEPTKTTLSDGTVYIRDIQYGEKYPNSYLDIYIPNGDTNTQRPTFFFIHGGGYAWGYKAEGDPLVEESEGENSPQYLQSVAENGYNVVSINYALTPDYLYPTPIYQIDEAVRFLQKSGDNYGLDMTNIIFSGGSAGGQLAGQYVNIQTNPKYAEEMELTASIKKENIEAVVFNSALLDSARFDKIGHPYGNFVFNSLGRLYFDTNDLRDSTKVEQSNVITHMVSDFPPTFITDGNTATFTDQAVDLDERMTKLDIPHEFNYYGKDVSILGHGYQSSLDNKYAKENFTKMLDFLDQHINRE